MLSLSDRLKAKIPRHDRLTKPHDATPPSANSQTAVYLLGFTARLLTSICCFRAAPDEHEVQE